MNIEKLTEEIRENTKLRKENRELRKDLACANVRRKHIIEEKNPIREAYDCRMRNPGKHINEFTKLMWNAIKQHCENKGGECDEE